MFVWLLLKFSFQLPTFLKKFLSILPSQFHFQFSKTMLENLYSDDIFPPSFEIGYFQLQILKINNMKNIELFSYHYLVTKNIFIIIVARFLSYLSSKCQHYISTPTYLSTQYLCVQTTLKILSVTTICLFKEQKQAEIMILLRQLRLGMTYDLYFKSNFIHCIPKNTQNIMKSVCINRYNST